MDHKTNAPKQKKTGDVKTSGNSSPLKNKSNTEDQTHLTMQDQRASQMIVGPQNKNQVVQASGNSSYVRENTPKTNTNQKEKNQPPFFKGPKTQQKRSSPCKENSKPISEETTSQAVSSKMSKVGEPLFQSFMPPSSFGEIPQQTVLAGVPVSQNQTPSLRMFESFTSQIGLETGKSIKMVSNGPQTQILDQDSAKIVTPMNQEASFVTSMGVEKGFGGHSASQALTYSHMPISNGFDLSVSYPQQAAAEIASQTSNKVPLINQEIQFKIKSSQEQEEEEGALKGTIHNTNNHNLVHQNHPTTPTTSQSQQHTQAALMQSQITILANLVQTQNQLLHQQHLLNSQQQHQSQPQSQPQHQNTTNTFAHLNQTNTSDSNSCRQVVGMQNSQKEASTPLLPQQVLQLTQNQKLQNTNLIFQNNFMPAPQQPNFHQVVHGQANNFCGSGGTTALSDQITDSHSGSLLGDHPTCCSDEEGVVNNKRASLSEWGKNSQKTIQPTAEMMNSQQLLLGLAGGERTTSSSKASQKGNLKNLPNNDSDLQQQNGQNLLGVTLMNSITTQDDSKSASFFSGSMMSPPRTNTDKSCDNERSTQNHNGGVVQTASNHLTASDSNKAYFGFGSKSQTLVAGGKGASGEQLPIQIIEHQTTKEHKIDSLNSRGKNKKSQKLADDNLLLQDKHFVSYIKEKRLQGVMSHSLTPNPKFLQQNHQNQLEEKQKRRSDRIQGQNFAGLQSYVISEIDSEEENNRHFTQKYKKIVHSDSPDKHQQKHNSNKNAQNTTTTAQLKQVGQNYQPPHHNQCLNLSNSSSFHNSLLSGSDDQDDSEAEDATYRNRRHKKMKDFNQLHNFSSSSSDEEEYDHFEEERRDDFMGITSSDLLLNPTNNSSKMMNNAIWKETPLTKENLKGFITESPFSFKNPIFFSAPRQDNTKRGLKLGRAKRQIFGVNQNQQTRPLQVSSKVPCDPNQTQTQQTQPSQLIQLQKPQNDFFAFVSQQQAMNNDGDKTKVSSKGHLMSLFGKKGIQNFQKSNTQPDVNLQQRQVAPLNQNSFSTTQQNSFVSPVKLQNQFGNNMIREEQMSSAQCSNSDFNDHMSNVGQGPSPDKHQRCHQQIVNSAIQNLNPEAVQQGVFKSMTPMPKLLNSISMPVQKPQQIDMPQPTQTQIESFNRERISRLKTDLIETPNSKYKYKQIARELKDFERQGFSTVVKETFSRILSIPRKVHWRVILDLADYAKRESKFSEAKLLFKLVSYLQPYAYQGWLEFAKMEEECGNQERSRKILVEGLKFSTLNENLFIKAVKVEEKLGNFESVRDLYGSIRNVSLERTWRMVLEVALFEGRIGNKDRVRQMLEELMNSCPSYGPIFFEASRYEEREGELNFAVEICDKGLKNNQKYGPLWFQYLRLYEKVSPQERISKFDDLQTIFNEMSQNVPRELDWKVYIEAAQTYERQNEGEKAIAFLSNAIQCSPDNIKWKLWLIASRIQFHIGEYERSREIIERCCYEVPSKQMSMAMLEYAKHFEMRGQPHRSRQIMQHTKRIAKTEWKTHFEAVLIEIRNGCFQTAEELVNQSLMIHFATGRLWATLIQLQHARAYSKQDFDEVFATFNRALQEIPKSGEVWCEGARLSMADSKANGNFDYDKAEKYLNFAIQFTPQYGDSFLEMLKLYLLTGQKDKIKKLKQMCIHAEPNYGVLWFYYKDSPVENAFEVWERAESIIAAELEQQKRDPKIEKWIASTALINHLRKGLKTCEYRTRFKIIYGFEQILPQVAYT